MLVDSPALVNYSPYMVNQANAVDLLQALECRDLVNEPLTMGEAETLLNLEKSDIPALFSVANRVRKQFCGDRADLCAISNARSGLCGEDCSFCPQSRHNQAESAVYEMKDPLEILIEAKQAEEKGAHRFCMVTSGGEITEKSFGIVLTAISLIAEKTSLMRCASLGRLDREKSIRLKEAGLQRYHHNLETSSSHYSSICTTQKWEDKLATARLVKESALDLCCGGILNLGESASQRIEMAFELRALDPQSVPVNLLNARPGTPLENQPALEPEDILKTLAIFRLVLPKTQLRLAGGRCENLGGYQSSAFLAGVNSLLVGDYLTTKGPRPDSDRQMLKRLGFDLEATQAVS